MCNANRKGAVCFLSVQMIQESNTNQTAFEIGFSLTIFSLHILNLVIRYLCSLKLVLNFNLGLLAIVTVPPWSNSTTGCLILKCNKVNQF